ncbi:hypothetical protein IAQ61_011654 [Plenodomus lingam]|uniref:uncharacterized protein n=1 Tax=Leptosphaeria maculans TaxID=5022 RepID=UPI0033248356|nr:hypothetical protein IAQ61_011654 [Plenodomus lingam]
MAPTPSPDSPAMTLAAGSGQTMATLAQTTYSRLTTINDQEGPFRPEPRSREATSWLVPCPSSLTRALI